MTFLSTHLNVETQFVPVIARLSPTGKDWRRGKTAHDYGKVEQALELFLPYEPACYGNIMCWTLGEGHNEASWGYYQDTMAPYSRMHEAAALIKRYAELLGPEYKVEEYKRLPHDWRARAWRR